MIAACPLSYLVAAVVITVQLLNRGQQAAPHCCGSPHTARDSRCASICPREPGASSGSRLYAIGGMTFLGFLFLWSGLYSVAASRGHWAIMEWLLTFAMRNSVKTHALGIEAPPLDNPDLVTLGAGHFHSGCAFCHGAPGVPISPIAQSMLPPPPDLKTQHARLARPRAVLDREERHQVHRHAGLGRAAARRRGLGAGRLPAAAAGARREVLSRAGARRRARSRRRAGARSPRRTPHRRPSAPARAATAPGRTARRARSCRSCTASRPNFSPRRSRPTRAGAARAGSCSRSRAISRATRWIASRATTPDCCQPSRPTALLPDATLPSSAGARSPSTAIRTRRVPACVGCHGAQALQDLSAARRPECPLHDQPAAALEGRADARHRRRNHHGADRAAR